MTRDQASAQCVPCEEHERDSRGCILVLEDAAAVVYVCTGQDKHGSCEERCLGALGVSVVGGSGEDQEGHSLCLDS